MLRISGAAARPRGSRGASQSGQAASFGFRLGSRGAVARVAARDAVGAGAGRDREITIADGEKL